MNKVLLVNPKTGIQEEFHVKVNCVASIRVAVKKFFNLD